MSLEKREGSPFYYYRFKVNGRRFFRSTETANKRRAEEVEREARRQAQEDAKLEAKAEAAQFGKGPMTLDAAALRYWNEVGQHHKASADTFHCITWLVEELGKDTLIRDIGSTDVARLVAKRRAMRVVNVSKDKPKKKGARKPTAAPKPVKLVSPARVNRSVTEMIRKILRRAHRAWGQEVQEIDWKDHLLKEPDERVRSATDDEEALLFATLDAQWHPIIYFYLRMGVREIEACNLEWPKVDLGAATVTILGKGAKEKTIPMPDDVVAMLRPLLAADMARRPAKDKSGKGRRVFLYANGDPITKWGLISAFRRAKEKAGIEDFKIHDMRHTAATRLLRESGNLKMAQHLLRHTTIAATARYAHVYDEDLREAMNQTHRAIEARREARRLAETEQPADA